VQILLGATSTVLLNEAGQFLCIEMLELLDAILGAATLVTCLDNTMRMGMNDAFNAMPRNAFNPCAQQS